MRQSIEPLLAAQLELQGRQGAAEWMFRRAADAFFGWNEGPKRALGEGLELFEVAAGLQHEEAIWLLSVVRGRVRETTTRGEVRQWFLELGGDRRALFVAGGLSLDDDARQACRLFEQSAAMGYAKAMNRLGYCLASSNHALLTSRGFLGAQQLRSCWREVLFATVAPLSHALQWQAASALVLGWASELVEMGEEAGGLRVTGEHDMYVAPPGEAFRKVRARELLLAALRDSGAQCDVLTVLTAPEGGEGRLVAARVRLATLRETACCEEVFCVTVPNGLVVARRGGADGAAVVVGNCCNLGQGCDIDVQRGAHWFLQAAALGHAGAQFNLGLLHSVGQGVPRDLQRACMWYRRAAEQGHAGAQFNLGSCYSTGCGASQNGEEALRWYQRAAQQGHALGQLMTGLFVGEGRGGAHRDPVAAAEWLRLAAAQECVPAVFHLGRMLAESGAREEGLELLQWAATGASSLAEAQHWLGVVARREGRAAEAAHWLGMASARGHAPSQCVLGGMFADAEGLPHDPARAASLFELAARAGSAAGAYRLGVCLLLGSGCKTDAARGCEWLLAAARQNHAAAAVQLARCHETGSGVERSEAQRAKWLGRAVGIRREVLGELRAMLLPALAARPHSLRTVYRLGEALAAEELQSDIAQWSEQERKAVAEARRVHGRSCEAARRAVLCWMGLVRLRRLAHRDLARPVGELLWAARDEAEAWLRE